MPDDRKKMLEALAAKRKAEALGGNRQKKPKPPSFPSKPVAKIGGDKPKLKPSVFKEKEKEKVSPKKKKRVEKYESEGSDEEEDDVSSESEGDFGDDSEVETVKKSSKNLSKAPKGKTPLKIEGKGPKSMSLGSNGKGKEDVKGKGVIKEKVKGKKKAGDSSDEGVFDEDDGGDLSEDPLDEVDPTNILPSRTRRRSNQSVHYDFGNVSDDDDDSDA